MTVSYSFPSIFEGHNTELQSVSQDLLNGLKILNNGDGYIVGELALSEGFAPHKVVNSSPNELDYIIMLRAGLLLANFNYRRPITLTTGFPFSTYQINREIAKNTILGDHIIEFDPSPFSSEKHAELKASVVNVDILPEMLGNITALREGEAKLQGDFFVVSLGYGTCEAVLSTEAGIVQRTATSVIGLQYAIELFVRELSKSHYLGLKTKKQLDTAFQKDFVILDRKKVNITELRRKVLHRYYNDIIEPAMRFFTDEDFDKAHSMYITGGGALYTDLVEEFTNEFDELCKVKVVDEPLTLTSRGYCLNSMKINSNKKFAAGLDIGNSNTVITQFEEGVVGW